MVDVSLQITEHTGRMQIGRDFLKKNGNKQLDPNDGKVDARRRESGQDRRERCEFRSVFCKALRNLVVGGREEEKKRGGKRVRLERERGARSKDAHLLSSK